MSTLENWYKPSDDDSCLSAAADAFENAKVVFAQSLTRDREKVAFLCAENTIDHVLSLVNEARRNYESTTGRHKASRWLAAFSSRIMYYGGVLDTLSQYHPEYVALAWGTMKLIFVGVLNHKESTSTFAKALCRIADCLPRQELHLILYPTKQMKQEVARLYAYLIQFLIKALKWYQEGTFKHIIHSITQPVGIKYKDILENIEDCSRCIDQWAVSSAQAELRDVHTLQREVHTDLKNTGSVVRRSTMSVDEIMRRVIDIAPQLTTLISGQVNTNHRVFDLQLSQMLTITAGSSLQDPEISYRHGILRRNKSMQRASRPIQFLDSQKLKRWTTSEGSSFIIIKGPYSMRDQIRIFGVDLIEAVRSAQIPVLWALPSVTQTGAETITSIDVLKSLVQQAIRINKSFQNESTCALSCNRMQSAAHESDWFDILGSTLLGLPQTYIVFDTSILGPTGLTLSENFSWVLAFYSLLERLKARGSRSAIKLIFISYCETKHMDLNGFDQPEDFTLKIDPRRRAAPRERRRRKNRFRLRASRGASFENEVDDSAMEIY